jgi:hypothetical protein
VTRRPRMRAGLLARAIEPWHSAPMTLSFIATLNQIPRRQLRVIDYRSPCALQQRAYRPQALATAACIAPSPGSGTYVSKILAKRSNNANTVR